MAADSAGNDLSAVKVPTTGFAAIGAIGGALMEQTALEAANLSLPTGYEYLGLFTQDGGPTEEVEAGDQIEFFQQGYSLPSGADEITETLVLAEDNAAVRRLVYGSAGTGNTHIKTGAVPTGSFPYLRVTRYKNGTELRRNGMVHITAIEPEQETRGEVRSVSITFAFEWQDGIGTEGGWYQDAIITRTAGKSGTTPKS